MHKKKQDIIAIDTLQLISINTREFNNVIHFYRPFSANVMVKVIS